MRKRICETGMYYTIYFRIDTQVESVSHMCTSLERTNYYES